jgi:hypothetical protein
MALVDRRLLPKRFRETSLRCTIVPRKSCEAMAFEVKFIESAQITAPHLKKPLFVEVHRAEGSDKKFVDLSRSHKLARMLCLDGHQFYDCFGTVTVLDQLKSLRDDHTRAASGRVKFGTVTRAVTAKELVMDGSCVAIAVPSIAGCPARSLYVVLSSTYQASVRMELSSDNLAWLSGVIASERALAIKKHVDTDKAVALRAIRDSDDNLKHKLWIGKDGASRALRPQPEESSEGPPNKKKICMWLKPEESPAKTVSDAEAFISAESVTRNLGGRPLRLTQKSLLSMFGSKPTPSGSSSSGGEDAASEGS